MLLMRSVVKDARSWWEGPDGAHTWPCSLPWDAAHPPPRLFSWGTLALQGLRKHSVKVEYSVASTTQALIVLSSDTGSCRLCGNSFNLQEACILDSHS